ncbi:hypothetical protein [Peptostreptococcus faecalis]|uniref:hypothetical protein n=1 Tax=Peptostreptococcus faecalis TaxID=2045015 RepID=UPI000C7C9DAD|nr:hypothetical protein [Peptostreptococcus faecalis]
MLTITNNKVDGSQEIYCDERELDEIIKQYMTHTSFVKEVIKDLEATDEDKIYYMQCLREAFDMVVNGNSMDFKFFNGDKK